MIIPYQSQECRSKLRLCSPCIKRKGNTKKRWNKANRLSELELTPILLSCSVNTANGFLCNECCFLKTKGMYCFVNYTRYSIEVRVVHVFSFFLLLLFLISQSQLHNGDTVALVTQISSFLSVKGPGTAQVDCEVRFQCLTGSPYSMGITHHWGHFGCRVTGAFHWVTLSHFHKELGRSTERSH